MCVGMDQCDVQFGLGQQVMSLEGTTICWNNMQIVVSISFLGKWIHNYHEVFKRY